MGNYVNFLSDTETSSSSYRNRVDRLEKYNKYLKDNFFTGSKFKSITDLAKFLRLKVVDANSVDVINSIKPSVLGNDLNDPETEMVTGMLQHLQASEFVQMFLDSYMAPLNSDIKWRLGEVTGTKIFNYIDGKALYEPDKISQLVQYDEFGRIDTTANFRYKVKIDGLGSSIRSAEEYLVNYFFPPYTADAFAGLDTKYIADQAIRNRVWVDTIYNDYNEIVPCKVCGKKGGHWHYPDMNNDMVNITFDTKNLMSMRENPTYRKVAFKPINDNISLLQRGFEYVTGIVSTYLTEWDISLYIQEGLLADTAGVTPSILTICNRITKDNPCKLTGSNALNFGVLNGAISKLDINSGLIPCKAEWDPSAYPLSTYWWPLETKPRGKTNSVSDQLPTFYDEAKKTWSNVNIENKNTRDKIRFFDSRGAAYSGWRSWDRMKYASSIYTTPDDGLSDVDVIHMCEETADFTFCDTVDKSGQIVDGEIQQIINLFLEDGAGGTGGTADGSDGDEYYYDENGNRQKTITVPEISVSDSGDDDSGWIRTCKSFVRRFFSRNSTKDNALKVGKKSGNGFMNAMMGVSNDATYVGTSTANGGAGSNNANGDPDTSNAVPSLLNTDASVNGQYSRQDGVSQWAPALYGGPHGRFYSPKTLQAWWQVGNPFLRDIPRIKSPSSNSTFHSKPWNFSGVEKFYTLTENLGTEDPSRSPTKGLSILKKGSITYTQQAVQVLNTYWTYTEYQRRSHRKWGWFWWGWEYYLPDTYNGYKITYTGRTGVRLKWDSTGYISSWPNVCTNWPWCPHYYSDGWYEWNTYYSYTNARQSYWTKTFYGYGNVRQYNGSSIVSTGSVSSSSSYGSGFGGRATSGTKQLYLLKSASFVTTYEAYYKKWDVEYKKRPLLHASPAAKWRITPAVSYSAQIRMEPVYRNFWDRIYNWIFRHSTLTIKYVYSLGNMRTTHRLTFPNSGYKIVRNAMTTSGSNTGYPYLSSYEEQSFIENVLGKDEGAMKGVWVPIWFIQGESSAIKNGRPNMIFRAYCRVLNDTYFAGYWEAIIHRSWCSSWVEYVYRAQPQTAQYIEIDMNRIAQEPLVLSGFDVEPYSNMNIASKSNDLIELKGDIPTTGRTKLYSSPFEFQKDMYNPITYPGRACESTPYKVIEGYGYTSVIPWILPRTDLEYTQFENPNDWCCLNNMGNNPVATKSISQMMSLFKFPTRDSRYTTIWRGWKPSLSWGINATEWVDVDSYTRGFQKVLVKILTTSTFFKNQAVETYRDPYIVENSNPLRTMTKIALHQKAWLQQCKTLYLENLDFPAVISIINTCIDTSILSRSIKGRKLYGQFDSIYYHYWIDKAYDLFSDPNTKQRLRETFDRIIGQIDNFITGNRYQNNGPYLVDLTMDKWSYNSMIETYEKMSSLASYINNSNASTGDMTFIGDFMYAYLNVLYEYRKFFINKRCNKVDGTLWTMRELEGAIPMVTKDIKKPSDPSGGGQAGVTCNATGTPQWSYKVDYYSVNNSNFDKIQAGAEVTAPLNMDRTKYIYIEVKYVDQLVVEDYLEKVKANRWDESKAGRYIFIPETQKWAELPFDGMYRYESTEFLENLAKEVYNEKAKKVGRLDLLKNINENIQECKFNISWSDGTGGLNEVIKGGKTRKILDMNAHFPYVYKKPKTEKYPSILFNVMSGIDLTKVGDIATKIEDPSGALSTVCYLKQDKDYWQIRIPDDKMPLTVGYLTNLSIKTLLAPLTEYDAPDISFPGAATGAFGYMLYPIVEEQANSIPGIGVDLNGISEKIKEQSTSLKI